MSLDQSIDIGPLHLETPLIAASSSATAHLDDLQKLNNTAIGAIIFKSVTLEERAGNPERNYFSENGLTVNAKGLPGKDLDGSMRELEKFNQQRKKPLILSVAGMKPAEYLQLIEETRQHLGKLFDAYEINLSCPNVAGKPIIGYDNQSTHDIISEILQKYPDTPLGIKLPPFFSEKDLEKLGAQIQSHLNQHKPGSTVDFPADAKFYDLDKLMQLSRTINILHGQGLLFVSSTNTLPNCRLTDEKSQPIIRKEANGGRGGLSGQFLHDISVENVRILRENLATRIPIIGTGGVRDYRTAQNFLDAGASAIGIGAGLLDKGPQIVEDILLEYSLSN